MGMIADTSVYVYMRSCVQIYVDLFMCTDMNVHVCIYTHAYNAFVCTI